jgi:hypothetical protein
MQDLNFLRNRRVAHGGRLQPVAQSLVVEQDAPGRPQLGGIRTVPIVDEFRSIHGELSEDSWYFSTTHGKEPPSAFASN